MKVCKVVPSAELSSEEEPSLKSLYHTPEDAAARDKDAWQELHLAWVFHPAALQKMFSYIHLYSE